MPKPDGLTTELATFAERRSRSEYVARRFARRVRFPKATFVGPSNPRARSRSRIRTRTQSHKSSESIGSWMLDSTTVQSARTVRPVSTFASCAAPTNTRLIASRVAGFSALRLALSDDFVGTLSVMPKRQKVR